MLCLSLLSNFQRDCNIRDIPSREAPPRTGVNDRGGRTIYNYTVINIQIIEYLRTFYKQKLFFYFSDWFLLIIIDFIFVCVLLISNSKWDLPTFSFTKQSIR